MRRFFFWILLILFTANFISWTTLQSSLDHFNGSVGQLRFLQAFFLVQLGALFAFLLSALLGFQPGTGLGRLVLSWLMIWNMLLVLPVTLFSTLWLVAWHLIKRPVEAGPHFVVSNLVFLPLVLSLLLALVAVWQLGRFRINRLSINLPDLPVALDGLTIVHLSDLHVGKLTRGKILTKITAAVNHLQADLVLVTGDLVNMSLEDFPRTLELLHSLQHRVGIFLCEGNHDLIQSPSEFERAAKASGLAFLFNERAHLRVKGILIQIIGLRWGEAMSVPSETLQLLRAADPAPAFTILLAHHPEVFEAAAAAQIPLTLSGHTHGGQMMLTPRWGFGSRLYRYWSGLYHLGQSQLVVSNGVGNWFPLRINVPAEIIHLTLRSSS